MKFEMSDGLKGALQSRAQRLTEADSQRGLPFDQHRRRMIRLRESAKAEDAVLRRHFRFEQHFKAVFSDMLAEVLRLRSQPQSRPPVRKRGTRGDTARVPGNIREAR